MFVWETLFLFYFYFFFHAQIESMLTYTAEVWGLEDVARIGKTKKNKKVQTFAIKRFLNVPLHSSNTII